jgi:UDP-hydrolysing UDP-N-acetyl-D-glucosamine 2-epimerase
MKKKICFVILSRANYGSIKSLMLEVKKNKKFTIQIIVGGAGILKRFGNVSNVIKKDGFKINSYLDFQSSNLLLETMSSTVGNGLIKISEAFKNLKPDFVFTVGDRYETIATALAAIFHNIPLCHTMGGERTGTIDESIRHSISKLAHIHFVSNVDAKKRLIKMGEERNLIFNVGCPRIDIVKKILKNYSRKTLINELNKAGVGAKINYRDPLIIFSQHPVTSEFKNSKFFFMETLKAITMLDKKYKIIYLWPNSDPGSDIIAGIMRNMREKENMTMSNFRFITNLSPEIYFQLMKGAELIIGNSSSAIREGAFIGTPAIDIGTRQSTRVVANNVVRVDYDSKKIFKVILKQIGKKYKSSNIYGTGESANKIVKILKKLKKVGIQKLNTY